MRARVPAFRLNCSAIIRLCRNFGIDERGDTIGING